MKRTILLLLAALVVLAAILLKKNRDEKSIRSDAPALDSTRKAEVKSIHVGKQKTDSTDLEQKDGIWVVAPDAFPVDTTKINKLIKNIFSLQNKEVVSHNPARYSEYGLDSVESRHVIFLDGFGKALADVVIGKTSVSDFNSTYWRWTGKDDVYRTPGNFAWEIGVKPEEWKERKLTQAKVTDLKTIETTWKDSTGTAYHYKLQATSDTTWKMLEPQDSNRVQTALVSEMASRFTEMMIDEFVSATDTNLSKVKVDSPAVWVKVTLKNGKTEELKASKGMDGFAYTSHPARKELIRLSTWRLDSYKKKPFELLALSKSDSAKAALTKPVLDEHGHPTH